MCSLHSSQENSQTLSFLRIQSNSAFGTSSFRICGQFPESEGNSIYNLTFLDEATQYAFAVSIPDNLSETVKKEFSHWIAAVERETGRQVKCLRTDEGEYQGDLTHVLKSLGIKHEKTPPRALSSTAKRKD
jgi:hypothetical protein